MAYNLTEITRGSNLAEWLIGLNSATGGVMMIALVVGFTVLLYGLAVVRNYSSMYALSFSTFFGFVLSTLLWLMRYDGLGLINSSVPVIYLLLFGFSLIMLRYE